MKNQADLERAQAICEKHRPARFCRLDRLEDYVKGSQYEGLPGWLDSSVDVPMTERAPHIVEPVVATAIESNCDFITAEGRWPTVTTEHDAEELAAAALSDADSEVLGRFVAALDSKALLHYQGRSALTWAQRCGTSVTLLSLSKGRVVCEQTRAKWCTPTWAASGELVAIEIRYPYISMYADGQGATRHRAMLYRRRIDAELDVVFLPAEAPEDGSEPSWIEGRTVVHGYGFVPVVWWRFADEPDTVGHIDGHAIHEDVLDELDALNRNLSQRDRAAYYAGDPQPVEIGVDLDHNPAPGGRAAKPMQSYPNESPDAKRSNSRWIVPGDTGAERRKRGPGVVWRYPTRDGGTEVFLLTLPPGAFEGINGNIADIREILAQALAWTRMTREQIVGISSLSGKALEWLYRRQLARCAAIRVDFEHGWLRPVIELAIRMVAVHASRGERVFLPGAVQLAPIVSRFTLVAPDGTPQWMGLPLEVTWPEFIDATPADASAEGKDVRDDLDANIITLETAVRMRADNYGITDVAGYVEELEEAKDKRMGTLHAAFGAAKGKSAGATEDGGAEAAGESDDEGQGAED